MIHDQNLKKIDTYSMLNVRWKHITDPKEIIQELGSHQDCFLDLKLGTNIQNLPQEVSKEFRKFNLMPAPSSSFTFLMKITKEFLNGNLDKKEYLLILKVLQ